LQAADPTNPDRVVISIARPGDGSVPLSAQADSVLVSIDQGASFKPYVTVTEVGGVAFASDGRVWIGDQGNALDPTQPVGLYFAKSLAVTPAKLPNANYPVQCLEYRKETDTLYACERVTFGTVDVTDGSFTTSLDVGKVARFVECQGIDMAKTCETQLCGAYCGLGHFAMAPVCCAYDTFSCGPAASPAAVCPILPDAGEIVDGGNDGGGLGSGGLDGGGFDANAPGGAGAVAGANENGGIGGAAGRANGGAGDGGCCSVAGRTRSGAGSAGAFALATAVLALRRRRRQSSA